MGFSTGATGSALAEGAGATTADDSALGAAVVIDSGTGWTWGLSCDGREQLGKRPQLQARSDQHKRCVRDIEFLEELQRSGDEVFYSMRRA